MPARSALSFRRYWPHVGAGVGLVLTTCVVEGKAEAVVVGVDDSACVELSLRVLATVATVVAAVVATASVVFVMLDSVVTISAVVVFEVALAVVVSVVELSEGGWMRSQPQDFAQ